MRLWRQVLNMYIGLFARLCNPILLLSKSLQQPALASPSPHPQWIFTSEFVHLYFLFTKYKALNALYGVEGLFKLTILPTQHTAPHGCKDVDLCVVNLYTVQQVCQLTVTIHWKVSQNEI